MDITKLQSALADFARDRDWDQFHTPKNLASALAVEAAEILELFQWLTPEQSLAIRDNPKEKQHAADEIADTLIYLLRLADKLDIDIESAVAAKMLRNAEKYPVELARGNATKYNKRES
ncbi:MAG: nucleotide pyrophosphohydrolase [Gammaproteobacteria bacterium]|nr:MAG: nucleotide pyrophosphohydrolase [Gammaproteobacteria bacterium]